MNNFTTSEVLDLAADEIQRRGWTQGNIGWEGKGSGLCLEGGIAAAMGSDVHLKGSAQIELLGRVNLSALQRCPAYVAVQEYLATPDHLWRWNDRIERTQEDVIAVLRAAAAVERVKEAAYAPVEVAA